MITYSEIASSIFSQPFYIAIPLALLFIIFCFFVVIGGYMIMAGFLRNAESLSENHGFSEHASLAVTLLAYLASFCFIVFIDIDDTSQNTDYPEETFNYEEVFDDGFDEGFIEGYYSGFDEIYNSVYEAEHHAAESGGWHPEEAMAIINSYVNQEPFYVDGSLPSKEDYELAVESLICFYEYYYLAEYESLSDPLQ